MWMAYITMASTKKEAAHFLHFLQYMELLFVLDASIHC